MWVTLLFKIRNPPYFNHAYVTMENTLDLGGYKMIGYKMTMHRYKTTGDLLDDLMSKYNMQE